MIINLINTSVYILIKILNLSLPSNFLLIIRICFSQSVSPFLFCTLVHWYEFIDLTCVWYLRMFVCFSLTFLTWFENFSVHPCCCQYLHFILFDGWVIVWCIDVPCSLHFSASGHFGGFYVLAVVNSAGLETGVHVSFWMRISPDLNLGVGFQDHVLPVCLVFKETLAVFHSGFTSYIPTKAARSPLQDPFLYVLCSAHSLSIFSMMAVVTRVRRCFTAAVIGIDLIITGVEYVFTCFCYFFVMCFCYLLLYTLSVRFTSWICFPESWPCMEFFSDNLPQAISWGRVSFTALWDLWLLRSRQHVFYGIYINLNQLMALCPLKLSSLVTIVSFLSLWGWFSCKKFICVHFQIPPHLSFLVSRSSHSMTISSFFPVPGNGIISSLFLSEYYCIVYM